jgi:hypothetical protein
MNEQFYYQYFNFTFTFIIDISVIFQTENVNTMFLNIDFVS